MRGLRVARGALEAESLEARTLDEGGVALDGMAMFTAQAEAQYHAWIGHRPPAGLFDRIVAGPG